MPNCFRGVKIFVFNIYCTCIRINFDWFFICFNLSLYFNAFICINPCSILADMISTICSFYFKWISCCLSRFCMPDGCCDSMLWESLGNRKHKVSKLQSFLNSNSWLESECLYFIRTFQSSSYYFKIKMAKKHLCSYFQLKAKENNEEAQSLK